LGVYTQNIERIWRKVCANIPRYGIRETYLIGYLTKFVYKRKLYIIEQIVQFFKLIGKLYPPISTN